MARGGSDLPRSHGPFPTLSPVNGIGRYGTSQMHSISSVMYVGHATVLIEMDGLRLLTDPVLRRRVGPLVRQVATPPSDVRHVDAALISHPHWDHLDPPSLRMLADDPPILVPKGTASFLRSKGMRNAQEIAPGERTIVGDVVVEATLARHSGLRPPLGPATDCVGFLLRGSHQIYFAGDTDLFPEMHDLTDDLDVALLPIWGWGLTLGAGHMDPLRAAQSLIRLRPRVAIPIHWGTYRPVGFRWMGLPFLSRPPRDFAAFATTLAPDVEVCILEPGQSLDLAKRFLNGPDPKDIEHMRG